jgi:hypothetical protein
MFYPADSFYKYDDTTQIPALLTLHNVKNLKIKRAGNYGVVKFSGVNNNIIYSLGIQITGLSADIEIDGIDFWYFPLNSIKVQGIQADYISGITVQNCRLFYNTGIENPSANCAAIKMQHTRNIIIEKSEIVQGNYNAQLDGIFMDACEDVIIRNNRIILEENEFLPQHLDCIEITQRPGGPFSGNITIENNYIENASTMGVTFRQGVHVLYTFGKIRLINNIIVSGRGRGLINVFFHNSTDSLYIFNNTLIGKGNPHNLVRIKNADGRDDYGLLNIKNNIFYKEGTGAPVYALTIWFDSLLLNNFSNSILNNNLYWNTNPAVTPVNQFHQTTRPWNTDTSLAESYGVSINPQLNSFYIPYSFSNVKNKGEGLAEKGVTKDISGNDRPYWNDDYDIGAYEIEDSQLKFGVTNVGEADRATHYLKALGNYWERENGNWRISNDETLTNARIITRGAVNDNTSLTLFDGLKYKWLSRNNLPGREIAAGFYLITNDLNPDTWFYLDLRDAVKTYSPIIYLRYNNSDDKKVYQYYTKGVWNNIDNGAVLRIWEIKEGISATGDLDSYWSNVLIKLEDRSPGKFIWSPVPGEADSTKYLVSFQKGITYQPEILDTLSGEYEYYVSAMHPVTQRGTGSHRVRYYIIANTSGVYDTTNFIEFVLPGYALDKENEQGKKEFIYSLGQNYPNPFNPSTTINFSIAEKEYVNIKLYDITGSEVKTLVDGNYDSGTYSVKLEASGLSSGVYFYRITAGAFSTVRKLQFLK